MTLFSPLVLEAKHTYERKLFAAMHPLEATAYTDANVAFTHLARTLRQELLHELHDLLGNDDPQWLFAWVERERAK